MIPVFSNAHGRRPPLPGGLWGAFQGLGRRVGIENPKIAKTFPTVPTLPTLFTHPLPDLGGREGGFTPAWVGKGRLVGWAA